MDDGTLTGHVLRCFDTFNVDCAKGRRHPSRALSLALALLFWQEDNLVERREGLKMVYPNERRRNINGRRIAQSEGLI